ASANGEMSNWFSDGRSDGCASGCAPGELAMAGKRDAPVDVQHTCRMIEMPNASPAVSLQSPAFRGLQWVLTLLMLFAPAGLVLAAGATSQRDINPTGGTQANGSDGLRVWVGSNSQFQVNLGGSGQVYSSGGLPTGSSLF